MGKIHDRLKAKASKIPVTPWPSDARANVSVRGVKPLEHKFPEWKNDRTPKSSPDYDLQSADFEIKFVIGWRAADNKISVVTCRNNKFHMDQYLGDGFVPLSAGYVAYDPENPKNMQLRKYSEGYCIGQSEKAIPYLIQHLNIDTHRLGQHTIHDYIEEEQGIPV